MQQPEQPQVNAPHEARRPGIRGTFQGALPSFLFPFACPLTSVVLGRDADEAYGKCRHRLQSVCSDGCPQKR